MRNKDRGAYGWNPQPFLIQAMESEKPCYRKLTPEERRAIRVGFYEDMLAKDPHALDGYDVMRLRVDKED